MTREGFGNWCVAFLLCFAVILVTHPIERVIWLDGHTIVEQVQRATPWGAITFQRDFHPKSYVRPVRAVIWWGLAHVFGTAPVAYELVNAAAWAAFVALAMALARRLHAAPGIVGVGLLVSYLCVYPLMYVGYAITACLALGALLAYFSGVRWQWTALLLLLAALSHETFLALALVPLLAELVWAPKPTRGLRCALVVPAYFAIRLAHGALVGTEGVALGAWSIENPIRVVFTVLSFGLPLEPLRGASWLDPYLKLRDMLFTPLGFATVAAVGTCGGTLYYWSLLTTSIRTGAFYAGWLALTTLPLMLPVAPPENFHLTMAVVAGLCWLGRAWVKVRHEAKRMDVACLLPAPVVVAAGLLVGVHVGAQSMLFWRDLPRIARVVHVLEREPDAASAAGVPIMAGPHYAMLPSSAFKGCLRDPVWLWDERIARSAQPLYERGGVKRRLCA